MSMYNTNNHEDRNFILLVTGIIGTIIIIGAIVAYYTLILPDNQLIDKWNLDLEKQQKESQDEKSRLNTITCEELKKAIANNEFVQEPILAQQKYIGMCT
jgi:hypothetical protein